MQHIIEGNIVDIRNREVFQGSIEIVDGKIEQVRRHPTHSRHCIMPGFIDAHVHIESSMLTPENFGRMVIGRGTIATVSDPHEIANVAGISGVEFMLRNSMASPVKIHFTIPSCVPATAHDRSGGKVSADDVAQMAASGQFVGLSEMMDVPGVLNRSEEIVAKLQIAQKHHLPIDGHAPTLSGEALIDYVSQGISTDHECTSIGEAVEKMNAGMKIIIREGSAAKNYKTLKTLIEINPCAVMFCTDDSHPDELIHIGSIDAIVKMAVGDGYDLFDVLRIACINPIDHYRLDVGTLRTGDNADFMLVNNLEQFDVLAVYVNGIKQYDSNNPDLINAHRSEIVCINRFSHAPIHPAELHKRVDGTIPIIALIAHEILTARRYYTPPAPIENLESDIQNDILKIVYINRYYDTAPQVAFCNGFGLQKGAFASTISHDSHNIIAVGCSDKELTEAINALIEHRGGLSVCSDGTTYTLPLPVGGIMSDKCGEEVAMLYQGLNTLLHSMGCRLPSPLMTLSFMSLIVIPEIKIGESGLFDHATFDFIAAEQE